MTAYDTPLPLDDSWDLDHAIRTLEEAEQLRNNPTAMQKIEEYMKEKVTNLQSIEDQLFGKAETEDEDDNA